MNGADRPRAYLVTGATGFIGSHLVAALCREPDARVTGLAHARPVGEEPARLARLSAAGATLSPGDLLRPASLSVPRPRFDVCYHLAAFAETEDPSGPFEVNSVGTRNLLAWLGPNLAGTRLVYAGTLASVDRDYARGPLTEATPCRPRTPYGRTKLEGEELIRWRHVELGYDYTILRLCTIVGPGYRAGGMLGVFPKLLARGALTTRLNWPGRSSLLSVRDLVRVLREVATHRQAVNETYVVSNGEDPTFGQLLDQIAAVHGLPRLRLDLPAWLWWLAAHLAWPVAGRRWLPYRLRIAAWRLGHLIQDGLWADARKLNALLGMEYQPLINALRETYGKTEPQE